MRSHLHILLAEDDDDDYLLTQEALKEAHLSYPVHRVRDGEELMQYLRHQGPFARAKASPRPGLLLLDLNLPRKDGREALREIKADATLKSIPVIVLTTSRAEEDIARAYQDGVNSFISKPASFQSLVDTVRALDEFWFRVVELPPT